MIVAFVISLTLLGQNATSDKRANMIPLTPKDIPRESTLAYGAVLDKHLLVSQIRNDRIEWFCADLSLGSLKPLQDAIPDLVGKFPTFVRRPGFIGGPVGENRASLHKWRIGSSFFWATMATRLSWPVSEQAFYRIPLAGRFLKSAGEKPSDDALALQEPISDSHKYGGPQEDYGGIDHCISGMTFLRTEVDRTFNTMRDAKYFFDFDFVSLSSRHVALFTWVNRQVSLWDYKMDSEDPKYGTRRGVWVRKTVLDAPMGEPFHASAADGSYFLVLDSGIVYVLSESKGIWTISKHWEDRNRPIRAMLVESDGMSAYVFGKDFYFKLGKKIDVKPCRDVTKRGVKKANEDLEKLEPAARLAYECCRVLYENGELKPALGK